MGFIHGKAEQHFLLPYLETLSNAGNQILRGIAFSAFSVLSILLGNEWIYNFGGKRVQSGFMNLYSPLFFINLYSALLSLLFSSFYFFSMAFFLFRLSFFFPTFFCLYLSFLLLPSQLFITVIFFPSHWTLDVVLIDRRGLKAHSKAPVFLNRLLSHQKMYSNIPLEHIIWK